MKHETSYFLLAIALILIFVAAMYALWKPIFDDHLPPKITGTNWGQLQGHDAATEGCPGRYHEYAQGFDGKRFLISCWGIKP